MIARLDHLLTFAIGYFDSAVTQCRAETSTRTHEVVEKKEQVAICQSVYAILLGSFSGSDTTVK